MLIIPCRYCLNCTSNKMMRRCFATKCVPDTCMIFRTIRVITLFAALTHWGRVTHICVGKLTIIGSDNGLSPGRRQALIWTNAGILLIGPLGTNFSDILIRIQTFSFKKMLLKMSSAKWRPICLGLNVLTHLPLVPHICVSESGQHWFG